MTKVFKSSTTSKILSTNQLNTIEVNKDNIIEADSQLREVIQKGYLLTQINLSTIPDIIQEAIDNAILDAKTQTLADSLISTMRQTIENFDDGVYKKTYIDTTITYLEELLTQKASPEIAASIAEAKIAVATAEFATASQVGSLSSRVGSSESEILNVKETINTKDTARATQIEELQSSINQSLSNYSEAIDLYVDVNGNVKSQKIEKLEAGNSISKVTINELNEVVADAEGNYNAMVAKVIFDSDGKIVGFNFSDTNELTTFTINADVFKISNSTNTKTPFTIVGNELLIDGKVSFSNITDKTSVVTIENVQDAIRDNVTTIDGNKIVTSEAFVQNLNATGGVVADTIKANRLSGMIFDGALIIGSVIRASYLDLDGEIQVLTNYHLCVTQEKLDEVIANGGNGALFTSSTQMIDAIPIKFTDVYTGIESIQEYRIPSISRVTEITGSASNGTVLIGRLRSYNTYNAGHNMKAVKKRPIFSNSSSMFIYKTISNTFSGNTVLRLGSRSVVTFSFSQYDTSTDDVSGGIYCTLNITNNITGVSSSYQISNAIDTLNTTLDNLPIIGNINISMSNDYRYVVIPGSFDNDGNWNQGISGWGGSAIIEITLSGGSSELPFDWNNSSDIINISGTGTYSLSGIAINNMV